MLITNKHKLSKKNDSKAEAIGRFRRSPAETNLVTKSTRRRHDQSRCLICFTPIEKAAYLLAAVFLFAFWQGASAQEMAGPTIQFSIFKDGRPMSGPHQIQMGFCGKWVSLPIHDRKFVIPRVVPSCSHISLRVKAGTAFLQTTTIPADRLRAGVWQVLFADKRFGHGFDSYVTSEQNIKRMCVVSFEPNGEGEPSY